MATHIKPLLKYVTRNDWGADNSLPRLGDNVAKSYRTHVIFHHTVIVDSDASKNIWENETEIFAKMKQLQVIRPDLGLDVPYNHVVFLTTSPKKYPMVIVCEGRGNVRSGAHTARDSTGQEHNYSGIGIAVEGNLENYPTDVFPWTKLLSYFCGWLKYPVGMGNLATIRPEPLPGRAMWGHQDFSQTACPGKSLWDDLIWVRYLNPLTN